MLIFVLPLSARKKAVQEEPLRVKYVFYMIGDGMGVVQPFATNVYNKYLGVGTYPVNFSDFDTKAVVTTHCHNTLVTDSAAAGTALATGSKTNSGSIGVNPEGVAMRNVAEDAKANGYGAGVVTSVGVNNATPAAFYAHSSSRSNNYEILNQLFAADLDFAAGGGFDLDKKHPLKGADYAAAAREAGMGVYAGRKEISSIDKSKRALLVGSLERSSLPLAIDRGPEDTRLSDFTSAAIDYMYERYPQGFFLMVEGGLIDHAAHNNDAVSTFQEINDFAESVDLVLEFYRQHPDETVIIVTADHDTGAMSIGAGKYEVHPELLAHQTVSKNALTSKINALAKSGRDVSWEEVRTLLSDCLGLWSYVPVTEKQERRFVELYNEVFVKRDASMERNWYANNTRLVAEAIDYLDQQAGFKFSFSSHAGSPVGLYVFGAQSDEFRTCNDNTDIPAVIRRIAEYK